MPAMDADLKQKWVNALRSGEYKQINGKLRHDKGHCCLGVLCEVAGLELNSDGSAPDENGSYSAIYQLIGSDDIGIDLFSMNDGFPPYDKRYSFAEIADKIEKTL